jgi:ATP-dependent Clp protease ATP-binding subunit ClpA
MLKDKNIKIKLLVKAKRWLRDKGYQPDMGARPLQRVVNDYIKKPLSKEILFGKLVNGGTVTIDIKDDEVKFEYS